jgi:hypothetical protein
MVLAIELILTGIRILMLTIGLMLWLCNASVTTSVEFRRVAAVIEVIIVVATIFVV